MSKNVVSRKESRIKGIFSSKKVPVEKRLEISPPTSGYRPGHSSLATTDINTIIPPIPRLPTSPPSLATINNAPTYHRDKQIIPLSNRESSKSLMSSMDTIPFPQYDKPPPSNLTPSNHAGSFHDLILNFNSSPRTPLRYQSRLELDLVSRDVHVEPEQVGQTVEVAPRSVILYKSATGDFGFSMNRCAPDEIPLHILEPRNTNTTQNGLISGDRLVEVNNYNVEQCTHDQVVDIIRNCGDSVELQVVAPPELYELAIRGALVPLTTQAKKTSTSAPLRRKSFHQRTVHSNFIGRMQKKSALRIRNSIREPSDTTGLHWLVHKAGYCGVIPVDDVTSTSSNPPGMGRYSDLKRSVSGLVDGYRVKVAETGQVLSVDHDDVEPAQNIVQGIENLAELTYLNETNCIHVLRTRYNNSLVHTYAGRHLIVINPIRELKCFSERVIEMFRGCQKDDMPPHIFAVAQTAYSEMRFSRQDQTLVMQGTSGSGKTYNARYVFGYLSTIAAYPHSELTKETFFAAEVLLLSMGSASTRLNGQATRFTNFTSLQFDSLGRLVSAVITPYLLERNRVVEPPPGEQNYNIFYQLYFSAEEQLSADLLLNQNYSNDKPHLNFSDISLDSAEYNFLWNLIQHSLQLLDISEEEARGIWSLLAAVYHLGHAGATVTPKGTGKFNDPVAAQNAATTLGTNVDTLQQELFYHMNTARTSYSSSVGLNSPSASINSNSSASSSLSPAARAQAAVKWFMIGLYEHAFHAMVLLINRALRGVSSHNKSNVTSINVLDTPGFQNYSIASETASFDDLCHNYTQERLQMLFFDYSFTQELDRYMEEEVPWTFSETPMSPLRIIDAIDKNSSQPKYSTDHKNEGIDSKGLFWILDEESSFPGSSDQMLVERIKINFNGNMQSHSRSAPPLQVQGESKFLISHFQNSYPVTYHVTNWLERVRENHSIRSVPAILSSSKRPPIAAIFQGKGIASASLNLSSQDGPLAKRYNTRRKSQVIPGIASTAKKSSVPLLTKFYLDFIMDEIRKSNQFFICCIVPHPPEMLPLVANSSEFNVPLDDFNIPFVRKQLKAGELLKATRIFKQGYPEMMHYSEFLRRFGILEQGKNRVQEYRSQKEHAKELLEGFLGLDKLKYKLGQSKVFFRVGTLHQINSVLEDKTNQTLINLQTRCRGYLARQHFKDLKVQELAIKCIQRNVKVFFDLKGSMWWDLMNEMKPVLEMKKTEDENRKLRDKIETLTQKLEQSDKELAIKRENEDLLEERIVAMTQALTSERAHSTELQNLQSAEQLANRELLEKVFSLQKSLQVATADSDSLKDENAKLLVRTESGREVFQYNSTSANQEVEALKQKVSQYKIELEETSIRKKKLDSQFRALEKERDDFSDSLEQFRRRFNKVNSELTDARIHGEEQASKYSELDKKQRKHEAELSVFKEAAASEKQSREKLTREKLTLDVELENLQSTYKAMEDQCNKLKKANEEMQLSTSTNATHDQHELSELRRQRNALELQCTDLEEERDEMSIQSERLEQEKQRLELEVQTIRRQALRETEGLEDEIEKTRASYNKKVKNLEQQIEEEREDKSALLRNKRDMEIELQQLRSEPSFDSVAMQKLRKKLILTRALLDDSQSEIKNERDKSQKAKSSYKNIVCQMEEGQTQVQILTRKLRNLNLEVEDSKESNEKMHMNIIDLNKQLTEVIRNKEEAETQLEEMDEDYKEDRIKLNSATQQLRISQAEVSNLQENILSLEDDKKRLETKIYDLEQQLKKETDAKRKSSNPANETRLRESELRVEQEISHKKRVQNTNHRLQSQLDKVQTELDQLKEHDLTKKLQTDIKKLRNTLQESEEREEIAVKKKRELERLVDEREQDLEEKNDQLRSLQQRSEKLKKTMETDFDEDLSLDDEMSTSFEDSPQIPRHYPYSRKSSLGVQHVIDNDFDFPRHSNHKHASSDLIDSDDNQSVRSSHSRNSSRFDYDVTMNNNTHRKSHLMHEDDVTKSSSLLIHSRHSPTDFLPSRSRNKRPVYENTLDETLTSNRTSELISKYDSLEEINKIGLGNRPNSSASSRTRSIQEKNYGSTGNAQKRNKSDLQFSDTDSVNSAVSSRTGQPEPMDESIISPREQNPSATGKSTKEKLLAKRQKRKDRTFQQEQVSTSNVL
ncbi:Unconventional myosin-XVIIIa [Oopsacas minuta]|uniref:Unconventional myosin-XVIIIa n=1 Tax=Oopsacas minuta TaxID=111878 RepID=A0AAV7JFH0_9METZ|nr:Unconventional myosin-XVIIIa [Oopsacas minuta]